MRNSRVLKPDEEGARLAADTWIQEIEAAGDDQALILKVGPPPNTGGFTSDWGKFQQARSTYWDNHFDTFVRKTGNHTRIIRDERDPEKRKQAILNFLVASKKVGYSYADRVLEVQDVPWTLRDLKDELQRLIHNEPEASFQDTCKQVELYEYVGISVARRPVL